MMNMFKTKLLVDLFMIIVAIGMIVVGVYNKISINKFSETAVKTTAIIDEVGVDTNSDGDTRYIIYVTYFINGREYKNSFITSSYMYKDSEITIYYDKNNPEKAKITLKSDNIEIIAGIIFVIIMVVCSVPDIRSMMIRKKIQEDDGKIYVKFKKVDVNYSPYFNGRKTYSIICEKEDDITGKIKIFKSETLWKNPEDIIREKDIKYFPIVIDDNSFEGYKMILDEIK